MNLPLFEECIDAQKENRASALHNFIAENEPADEIVAEMFRNELQAVIVEHCKIDRALIEDAFKVAMEYCTAPKTQIEGVESDFVEDDLEKLKKDFYIKHGLISK